MIPVIKRHDHLYHSPTLSVPLIQLQKPFGGREVMVARTPKTRRPNPLRSPLLGDYTRSSDYGYQRCVDTLGLSISVTCGKKALDPLCQTGRVKDRYVKTHSLCAFCKNARYSSRAAQVRLNIRNRARQYHHDHFKHNWGESSTTLEFSPRPVRKVNSRSTFEIGGQNLSTSYNFA